MRHGGARVTGAAALTLEIVFRINAAKISHDAAQGHYASPRPPPLPSPRSLYGRKTTIYKSFSLYSPNSVTLRLPYYVLCRSITFVLRKLVKYSPIRNLRKSDRVQNNVFVQIQTRYICHFASIIRHVSNIGTWIKVFIVRKYLKICSTYTALKCPAAC